MFLVFTLYALFASVFTIAKTALEYSQPLFLVGSRMLLAGIVMLAYQYFFHRSDFKFKKEHVSCLIRLAVFNIYLTNVFEFWGLKYLTSFKTCFIYSLCPFASALLSYFMLHEKMSIKKWGGLCIGFIGFIPILMNETQAEEQMNHLFIFSYAEISVMMAAFCSVYGWILLSQLVKDHGYTPIMANGSSMLLGGCISLIHSYFSEAWNPVPVSDAWPFIECALALIIISNLICYNLYGWLLRKFSATFISFAGFTTPLFTALFGWICLGEIVTLPFYVSAAIVFTGLFLFYQEELKQTSKTFVTEQSIETL